LGNYDSVMDESFSESDILEYPQYTRPEILTIDGQELKVPPVLLSGNHQEISKWKEKNKKR